MLTTENLTAILLAERLALTAFFASITHDFHLAEDVFQEICIKALKRSESFQSPAHLIHWSRLSGKNRCIDLLRARHGRHVGLSPEMLDLLAQEWPTQEGLKPMQRALAHCLRQLKDSKRGLLLLRYFEGRKCAEVASITGRKIETIYQALARLHRELGDCIRQRLSTPASP